MSIYKKIIFEFYTKLLVLVVLFLFFNQEAKASHMIGGDVVYRCLGNNVFRITITLYQDCLYGAPEAIEHDNPLRYAIFRGGTSSTNIYDNVFSNNISFVDPNFSNDCINNPPPTCLRKQVFTFDVTLSPSNTGYTIVYQRCCRNASINNIINSGMVGVTYSAFIPPYGDGECPNNSAQFTHMPPQIICVNNPFKHDFSATDIDGDSLSYRLCEAYLGGSMADAAPERSNITPPPHEVVPYMPPYTATTPVTGTPNMNIDPVTGILSGVPTIAGRFVVTVCVDEWRDGVVINTLRRDVQFVITNCSKAVIANIPELDDFPNVYTVECKSYDVKFKNLSQGGFSYLWEFGVNGATSTEFEPSFTYPDTGTYEVTLTVNPNTTCEDKIKRLVKIYPSFQSDFLWEGQMCPEMPIQFTDLTSATFPPINSWYWNFGDGHTSIEQHPIHTYPKPGGEQQVMLVATSLLGCRDTVIKKFPLSYFNPNAGNDTIIVLGYEFHLNGSGADNYIWSPEEYLSDPYIANPKATFPKVGIYRYILSGGGGDGCSGKDTVYITVVADPHIFVPNAFSPNGDGWNDVFRPHIAGYAVINSFMIYNRWGEQVYATTDENMPGWDGTYKNQPAEIGTYFWAIKCTNPYGEVVELKGDVSLLK